MKITKKGTKPADRKWVGSCRNCGAEAEATEKEMKHITYDQREDGSFSWEVCPACGYGDISTGYGGMLFYPKGQ
jgi:hypothetical protein